MSSDTCEGRHPEVRACAKGLPAPPRVAGLSAVVLCGGRSSRFGSEKGLACFRGVPLIERALARMDEISTDVWISTQQPDLYGHLGRAMVADLWPGCGPLGGVHAALTVVRNPILAVVPCDMPFASPGLFRYLWTRLGRSDAAVPTHTASLALTAPAGQPSRGALDEPLHAIYARSCIPAIEAALRRGERRVVSFFADARVVRVPEDEWRPLSPAGELIFANINTTEDLARLERAALG